MNTTSRALRCAIACVVIGAGSPAVAQAQSPDCRTPAPPTHPLADRSATLSWFEQMPERCLMAFFVGCSEAAGERLLDLGSAAMCSMGYEALLKQGFGGDFHALMIWWRRERDAGVSN